MGLPTTSMLIGKNKCDIMIETEAKKKPYKSKTKKCLQNIQSRQLRANAHRRRRFAIWNCTKLNYQNIFPFLAFCLLHWAVWLPSVCSHRYHPPYYVVGPHLVDWTMPPFSSPPPMLPEPGSGHDMKGGQAAEGLHAKFRRIWKSWHIFLRPQNSNYYGVFFLHMNQ